MAREHPDTPDPQGETGLEDGSESRAARDAAHWVAVLMMTLTPVVFLVAIYLWLRSLNS